LRCRQGAVERQFSSEVALGFQQLWPGLTEEKNAATPATGRQRESWTMKAFIGMPEPGEVGLVPKHRDWHLQSNANIERN